MKICAQRGLIVDIPIERFFLLLYERMNSTNEALLLCTVGYSFPQVQDGMAFMPKQGGSHGIPGQT
jgi:hypothetical protein